ncbi:MAG TPA: MFS transporter [Candidatus Eisenbacteria bacterium]|nr:MFS transporter [Candidatus Eisenbacteria bacterium]
MAHAVGALARDRNYVALWIGQFVSIFGDRFTYLALLAVVVARARDPGNPAAELALLPLASFLPAILFGPWIGAVVDRSDTRRVLIASDLARGVAVLAMIPATILGGLPALFALVFALYVANTFFLPARSAIVPLLVPAERLTEANSLATFAGVAATIAGSLAGGALIDRFGWAWGFALDAATYFVSVVALWRIRIAPRPGAASPTAAAGDAATATAGAADGATAAERYRKLAGEIREGFAILLRTPRAWMVTLTVMLLWMAGGVLHVTVPILVGESGRVASGVGSLIAAAAVGMILGTLGIAARGAVASPGVRLSTGLLGTGVSLAAFAFASNGVAATAVAFAAGLFVSLLLVTSETALQEAIGVEARGRVFALRDMAARLAVLATAGLAGVVVAQGLPPRTAVLAAGALLAVTGLIGFRARWTGTAAGGAAASAGAAN